MKDPCPVHRDVDLAATKRVCVKCGEDFKRRKRAIYLWKVAEFNRLNAMGKE